MFIIVLKGLRYHKGEPTGNVQGRSMYCLFHITSIYEQRAIASGVYFILRGRYNHATDGDRWEVVIGDQCCPHRGETAKLVLLLTLVPWAKEVGASVC